MLLLLSILRSGPSITSSNMYSIYSGPESLLSFFDLKFISGVGEQAPKSSVSPLRGSSGSTDRGHLPFLACFLPEKNERNPQYIQARLFLAQGVRVDRGRSTTGSSVHRCQWTGDKLKVEKRQYLSLFPHGFSIIQDFPQLNVDRGR